ARDAPDPRPSSAPSAPRTSFPSSPALEVEGAGARSPRRKLSYNDARELERLPSRIEALEADIAARTAAMHDPAFFRQDAAAIVAANQALADAQAEPEAAYARSHGLGGARRGVRALAGAGGVALAKEVSWR